MKNYNDLNVLVTGADGFIASHLCGYHTEKKANVTGLLRRDSGGLFKNLNSLFNLLWHRSFDGYRNYALFKFHF